ncbi:MAG: hypothetical protein WD397_00660 [Wenzhouxiangellaceae bacterium]
MRNQRQPSNQAVQRTSRTKRAASNDMRVNHGRAHIGMPRLILDRRRTMPLGSQIAQECRHRKKSDLASKIKGLGGKEMSTGVIKEQIGRLFEKNSFRHIFFS